MKNVGLLTLSNFATKLLSFFLVPLYTAILTTTEYGIYDLFYTTASVLVPVLTVNIQEAVLRFCIDKDYSRKAIVTVSVRYFLIGTTITFAGLCLNRIFLIFTINVQLSVLFFLMFVSQALSGIIMAYVRGIDKIADLSVSSIVVSITTIVCNILFLVVFNWGLDGYFLANIIGPIAQCLYLIVRSGLIGEIDLKNNYSIQRKEMVIYSKPLIANSIAWWVNNAFSRYAIVLFCSFSDNGIYSVASKIPSILNIVQSIFNQAWTLSAVQDFDPNDSKGFFSNTYTAYNCLLVLTCSGIILTDKFIARFLYAGDFYSAWKYVPWLTIAIVFGALSGYVGGFFSAVKNSKIFAQSTILGAAINIVLNVILTPILGIMGASISTAISYFFVWLMRYKYSRKLIKLNVRLRRDLLSYMCLILQSAVILFLENEWALYGVQFGLFLVILLLYSKDIRTFANKLGVLQMEKNKR